MKAKTIVRTNTFQRAWRGTERLWKIYWGYLLLGSAILMVALTIIVPTLYRIIPISGPIVGIIAVSAILVYWAWVTICMWRCAFNCNWRGWGIIAVGQMVLAWIGILLNILAFLLGRPPVLTPPIETP